MKALLLAAGYATRLRPLTDDGREAAAAGRRPARWSTGSSTGIADSGEIDGVHVVTNSVYAPALRAVGGRTRTSSFTTTARARTRPPRRARRRPASRSATGGLAGDDLLVIAADNLFEFSLARLHRLLARKGDGSAIAVHQLADPSLAPLYGVVELDEDDRVVGMEEKPEHPRSDLASTAMYLFSRRARQRSSSATSTRAMRPTRPAATSSWLCRARAGVRLPLRRAVARHRRSRSSCSRPTTATGRPRACPRATPTASPAERDRRHASVTEFGTDTSRLSAVPWIAWLFDLLLPSRCVVLRRVRAAALRALPPMRSCRSAPPLCARCGAPTAWPVERCRECSGRRLAFASARAAVRVRGAGAGPRARLEGARLRPLDRVAAELVAERVASPGRRRHHVYPARRRPQRSGAGTSRPKGSPASSGAAGTARGAALLRRTSDASRARRACRSCERRRNMRGAFAAARAVHGTRGPRRRRLHDGRDRRVCRLGAPRRGGPARPRRDARARGSLTSPTLSAVARRVRSGARGARRPAARVWARRPRGRGHPARHRVALGQHHMPLRCEELAISSARSPRPTIRRSCATTAPPGRSRRLGRLRSPPRARVSSRAPAARRTTRSSTTRATSRSHTARRA